MAKRRIPVASVAVDTVEQDFLSLYRQAKKIGALAAVKEAVKVELSLWGTKPERSHRERGEGNDAGAKG
jgi:hypothetical protein